MAATLCLQGIHVKSHALQLHVLLTKSTTYLSLSLSTLYTNLPDGIAQKPLHYNFNCSNFFYMLRHNLPPYFSMSIFFIYSLLISLTLIHSSINKMGLSLAFTIIELKLSLRLFTIQPIKALEEKWDLAHYAGSISARYFQDSSSKLLRWSIPLSNSLTDVVLAHLHNTFFNSMPLWLTLKLLYMCFTQYLCSTLGNRVSIASRRPCNQVSK